MSARMRSALRRLGTAGRGAPIAADVFEVDDSPLLSLNWYRFQVPEVRSRREAVVHYLDRGWLEGITPHPLFDGDWYLGSQRDLLREHVNPLLHFIRYGRFEGRSPHPLIDPQLLLTEAARLEVTVLREDLIGAYITGPDLWPAWSCESFYGAGYQENYVDVKGCPLSHYVAYGEQEGRSPSPIFDPSFYTLHSPDVADAPLGLLAHFHLQGWREFRSPHRNVDLQWVCVEYGEPAAEALPVDPARLRNLMNERKPLNSDHQTVAFMRTPVSGRPVTGIDQVLLLKCSAEVKILDSGQFSRGVDIRVSTLDSESALPAMDFRVTYDSEMSVELRGPWVIDLSWLRIALANSPSSPVVGLQSLLNGLCFRLPSVKSWARGLDPETRLSFDMKRLLAGLGGTDLLSRTVIREGRPRFEGSTTQRPSRVLLVSHEQSLTGAPIFLEQIAHRFVEEGAQVLVVSLRDDLQSDAFVRFELPHVSLGDICGQPGLPNRALLDDWTLSQSGSLAMRALVRGFQPDVAILSTVNASAAARPLFDEGVPYAMLVHERTGPSQWGNSPFAVFDRQVEMAMRGAWLVCFGSSDTRSVWERFVDTTQTSIVPTWRSEDLIPRPASDRQSGDGRRKSLGIPQDSFVFLSVATFEPRKRQLDLVLAFEALELQDAYLVLVGDGGAVSPELDQARRRAGAPGSRIHALEPRIADRGLYEMADCFVLASERETFPLAVQEAALVGLSVISAEYPGWVELFPSDYQLSYPVGDVRELTSLMKRVEEGSFGDNPSRDFATHIRSGHAAASSILMEISSGSWARPDVAFGPRGWVSHA
jgi:glycosyltransferase involved in cell wall biosynthesis